MTLLLRDQENVNKGLEIGREEGRKEGELKRAREIASRLFDGGMSIEKIATITGLDIEEIKELTLAIAK